MKISNLLLLSGNDIFIPDFPVLIHHPRIKEIAFIFTEQEYYDAYALLNITGNVLKLDKSFLEGKTNFDIFMSIMTLPNEEVQKKKVKVIKLLTLFFPAYEVSIGKNGFIIYDDSNQYKINSAQFEALKFVANKMIRNDDGIAASQDSPMVARIKQKIAEGKKRIAEMNGNKDKETDTLTSYISILSIGLKIDMNILLDYTIFQLLDSLERFQLKEYEDKYFLMKIQGASGMDEPESWLKDIYVN